MSHAEFSPSSAKRFINCPGSVAASRGIPRVDNAYSREGTFAHEVGALCLLKQVDAASQIGMTIGDFTLDAEMAAHVQVYLDAVRSTHAIDGGDLMVEQKVVVNADVFGTADAIIVAPHAVHVFDLKYGAGVFVGAEHNEQMMTYGLGAVVEHPEIADDTPVWLHIVQPRCNADQVWRSWPTTAGYLRGVWKRKLEAAVVAARQPNALLAPGDWCKFCPVKLTCPALRERALATAATVFPNLDAPATRPPSPTSMTPEQIAVVLAGEDILTTWLKGVSEMAFDLLKRGEAVPGWKLVAKTGLRKWNDEGVAAETLRNARIDPMAEPKIISPAAAEKLLAKTSLGKKGGEALVEKLAHKPITGEALVPVSDPRPAISAGSPFVPLT